jgi:hypothetical protein
MRWFYGLLLRLHPAPFRREYAGEMLWIFEEASASEGAWGLFLDGLISLARQWVVRSGSWRVPVAILGGLFQVTLGGMGWLAMEHPRIAADAAREQFRGEWVGEVTAREGPRKMELQLAPVGTAWAGKVRLDGKERAVRDVRVELGSVHFSLLVGQSMLQFEGRRAVRGGQVSGVVKGFEQGTLRRKPLSGRWLQRAWVQFMSASENGGIATGFRWSASGWTSAAVR